MKIVELKKRVPKFFVVPLLILFIFSIYSGVTKFIEKEDYNYTRAYLKFTVKSSALIHELQKERGYSNGYVSSDANSFKAELKQQRKLTDIEIKNLKLFIDTFNTKNYNFSFKEPVQELLNSFEKIQGYRKEIDDCTISSEELMEFYTNKIDNLFALIENIYTISHDGKLPTAIQPYLLLIQINEKAGKERALLNKIFGQEKLSNKEFYKFGELVSAQKIYIEQFKKIAEKEHVNLLNTYLDKKIFQEVDLEREKLYSKNRKNKILSDIKSYIGYGGIIHNFKNYLLYGDEKYANHVKKQYSHLTKAIDIYRDFENISKEEDEQLKIIELVFYDYMQGLVKVNKARSNDISKIDKSIEVESYQAIKAIDYLSNHVHSSQYTWFEHATNRMNLLKEVENRLANDLDIFMLDHNKVLFIRLVVEIIILFIILVVIVLSLTMLRELIESRNMLNRAQVSTKSGSFEYYVEDNVIFWSDAHYELLKVQKNKYKPTMESFIEFVHPDDRYIIKKSMEKANSSGDIVIYEHRIIRSDNKEIVVKSSIEVIKRNILDKPLIYVGTITDITIAKKLEQEIIDTQKDIIYTMGNIGETRSLETGKHVERVARYSELLYKLHGGTDEQADLLKMASPMHDIGKVGIPDNILNKPASLSFEEWEVMKTHAYIGYDLLKNSDRDILKLAATVALTHHEKYDGSGYPKGLVAKNIPIAGRITAMADVFDALDNDRCYKKAWKLEDTLAYMKDQKGKHFDPKLVELFFENLEKFLEIRDECKEEED